MVTVINFAFKGHGLFGEGELEHIPFPFDEEMLAESKYLRISLLVHWLHDSSFNCHSSFSCHSSFYCHFSFKCHSSFNCYSSFNCHFLEENCLLVHERQNIFHSTLK